MPYKSKRCDGGYISEALRYCQGNLIALRDNYPYLGFNSTCRKLKQEDLMSFKIVPEIRSQFDKISQNQISEFWSSYYKQQIEAQ